MFSGITITYSWWWIVVGVLTGLVYASILYLKNSGLKFSSGVKTLLFVLRFLAVSLLAFLLLSPYVKTKSKSLEKPLIIVGADNSLSMVLTPDSNFYKRKFPVKFGKLIDALKSDYETEVFLFGDKVKPLDKLSFPDKHSDYSSFFDFVKNNYRGMNVGAVVLLGDGIYNRGADPYYSADNLNVPVYTIALGDTNVYSDIKINDVRYNEIVYLKDKFPVEVNVTADKLKGKTATLKILSFGKEVYKKSFFINSDDFNKSFKAMIPADKEGKQAVKISLSTFENELNKTNNSRTVYVNIYKVKSRILIAAAAPHPDISAVKQSLTGYRNYEVDVKTYPVNIKNIKDYDIVIFDQLPAVKRNDKSFVKSVIENKIPALFILGRETSVDDLNEMDVGLKIKGGHGFEMAQPVVNPVFSLFDYPQEFANLMEKFPPLNVIFGNYLPPPGTKIFAYQKINNLETDIPLIMFYRLPSAKYGVVAGEGLWLWRMHNFMLAGNFEAFNAFIGKTVQYLISRENKRHLLISTNDKFEAGDRIVFRATLYNESWETVNNVPLNMVIKNKNGEVYKFEFTPYDNGYNLDAGELPPGIYYFEAKAKVGDKIYTDKGEFIVERSTLESIDLKANHNLLYRISSSTGGKMLFPENMNDLPEIIKNNTDIKTIAVYNYRITGLTDIILIAMIILFLLSLEWFLRKYFGSY